MSNNINILIVGAGQIAREYTKVLLALGIVPKVVTRGQVKAQEFKQDYPNVELVTGGVKEYFQNNSCPQYCIIATPVENLASITKLTIQEGCKNILVEKPLTYFLSEAGEIYDLSVNYGSVINIAFNRRFYQSVLRAKKLIEKDGGVTSFNFNFTEAIHIIEKLGLDDGQIKYLGIGNSCHPIDTAFFLGGKPREVYSRQYGNSISWHPAGSVFLGSGETIEGIPFSYHADWGSAGRWNVEIMTKYRKMIFSPMERLQQQLKGSFEVNEVKCDYTLDEKYKPGYYLQVKAFLGDDRLCSIEEYVDELEIIRKIFNY